MQRHYHLSDAYPCYCPQPDVHNTDALDWHTVDNCPAHATRTQTLRERDGTPVSVCIYCGRII